MASVEFPPLFMLQAARSGRALTYDASVPSISEGAIVPILLREVIRADNASVVNIDTEAYLTTLVLGHVTTDILSAYNASSGEFTLPLGSYGVFIEIHPDTEQTYGDIWTIIMKDGEFHSSGQTLNNRTTPAVLRHYYTVVSDGTNIFKVCIQGRRQNSVVQAGYAMLSVGRLIGE